MRSCDVNVLVLAYNDGAKDHPDCRRWLAEVIHGPEPFGLSSVAVSGFLRIVTNPRILNVPAHPDHAVEFIDALLLGSHVVPLEPGPRHWSIFSGLCRKVEARGNTVPDAYFAALAIEHGCEWNTTDRGFARFPGLRWRHPLSV